MYSESEFPASGAISRDEVVLIRRQLSSLYDFSSREDTLRGVGLQAR